MSKQKKIGKYKLCSMFSRKHTAYNKKRLYLVACRLAIKEKIW